MEYVEVSSDLDAPNGAVELSPSARRSIADAKQRYINLMDVPPTKNQIKRSKALKIVTNSAWYIQASACIGPLIGYLCPEARQKSGHYSPDPSRVSEWETRVQRVRGAAITHSGGGIEFRGISSFPLNGEGSKWYVLVHDDHGIRHLFLEVEVISQPIS